LESLHRFPLPYRTEVDALLFGERMRRLPVAHRDDLQTYAPGEEGQHEPGGAEDLVIGVGRHDRRATRPNGLELG
jgi:hypothetical protein